MFFCLCAKPLHYTAIFGKNLYANVQVARKIYRKVTLFVAFGGKVSKSQPSNACVGQPLQAVLYFLRHRNRSRLVFAGCWASLFGFCLDFGCPLLKLDMSALVHTWCSGTVQSKLSSQSMHSKRGGIVRLPISWHLLQKGRFFFRY